MRSRIDPYRRVAVLLVLAVAGGVAGAGVRVPLDKVPAPAVKAVKDRFPKAEIRFVDKEGKGRFEFAMKEGGRQFDVGVTAEGKVTQVKEEIKALDVPAAVMKALQKNKFPGATIVEAEKVVTGAGDSAKTVYELVIKAGKETHSVAFDPSGKFVGDAD
jgi:hypothetical protein